MTKIKFNQRKNFFFLFSFLKRRKKKECGRQLQERYASPFSPFILKNNFLIFYFFFCFFLFRGVFGISLYFCSVIIVQSTPFQLSSQSPLFPCSIKFCPINKIEKHFGDDESSPIFFRVDREHARNPVIDAGSNGTATMAVCDIGQTTPS
jgi:hypothetical protein